MVKEKKERKWLRRQGHPRKYGGAELGRKQQKKQHLQQPMGEWRKVLWRAVDLNHIFRFNKNGEQNQNSHFEVKLMSVACDLLTAKGVAPEHHDSFLACLAAGFSIEDLIALYTKYKPVFDLLVTFVASGNYTLPAIFGLIMKILPLLK
jgi:hypothetical protein